MQIPDEKWNEWVELVEYGGMNAMEYLTEEILKIGKVGCNDGEEIEPNWDINLGKGWWDTKVKHLGEEVENLMYLYVVFPLGGSLYEGTISAGQVLHEDWSWEISEKHPPVVMLQLLADRDDLLGSKITQVKAGETLRLTGQLGEHDLVITEDWPS